MTFLLDNISPILVLGTNVLASGSYLLIYSNGTLKSAFFKLPMPVQKVYVALFIAPLLIAPFLAQTRFTAQAVILTLSGYGIALLSTAFIVASFFSIGVVPSIKKPGGLSTGGVYKVVRHPIYAGTVGMEIGLSLANQALISLLYVPVSILLYYLMATLEEKDLSVTFGKQYSDYQKQVSKKLIPFIL